MRTVIVWLLLPIMVAGCSMVGIDGNGPGKNQDVYNMTRPNHIIVHMDGDNKCPLYVRDLRDEGTGGTAWCPSDQNPVSGAACRKKGDTIIWRVTGPQLIDIEFAAPTPADWQCDVGPSNPFKCTISEEESVGAKYKYTVTVNGCPLDPYIIIN